MKISTEVKLAVKGERELLITREFDAPRALVFDAHTQPALIRTWMLGPPGWTMPVCEVDLRVGGAYRYVWRNEDGREMGMGGVYREIAPPGRLVSTERFDDAWYPGEAVATLELVETGRRTLLTYTMLYESKEARDGVLGSGMEHGLDVSFRRLDEVLGDAR